MSEQTGVLTTEKQPAMRTPGEKSLATRDETRYIVPPVDIYETGEALTVIADLPGVGKDGVDVRVEDGVLTIKGKSDYTPPANILLGEFTLQGYYRQFQLTDEVDQNRISAESKNGVLTIHLPKAEKSKPKQIKVKLG
jgi:HSP20 family molecular chaperone IbpA